MEALEKIEHKQQTFNADELKLSLEMRVSNTSQDRIDKMLKYNRFIQYVGYVGNGDRQQYENKDFERYC